MGLIYSPQMVGIQAGGGRRKKRSPLVDIIQAQAAGGVGTREVMQKRQDELDKQSREETRAFNKAQLGIQRQGQKLAEKQAKVAERNQMIGLGIQGAGLVSNLASKAGGFRNLGGSIMSGLKGLGGMLGRFF